MQQAAGGRVGGVKYQFREVTKFITKKSFKIMKYASVCSGVEAASLAWEHLGWKPVWFSEIEPFPCEVLKQRFPNVPNLGDMTKIKVEKLDNGDQKYTNGMGTDVIVPGGVDLLVGGTPCQSFSVAGKREGLEGASGLARTFVELLGAMQPRWFVWENVPGVFIQQK